MALAGITCAEGNPIQGALLKGVAGEYCACASDDICADEQVMLAELAATLYNWPNRNLVFEKAIHAVALELLAMANTCALAAITAQPEESSLEDA